MKREFYKKHSPSFADYAFVGWYVLVSQINLIVQAMVINYTNLATTLPGYAYYNPVS